jgi:multiple sugar transport system permease protein
MSDRLPPGGARRPAPRWPALLWHVVALALGGLFLVPLASMLTGSLRLPGLPPPRGIEWLPHPLNWSNYPAVFQLVELGRYAVNTLVVEALAVPLTLLIASWAGFALAQLPASVARRILAGSLLLWLLPETALWVSRFILFRLIGLIDTPFALAAPALLGTSPLYVLVFYWTFRRVPGEVWEAAQLDGAGAFHAWRSIGAPAARAAFAAVGVLTFVFYWQEFNEPLIYIQHVEKYTLSVGLAYLEQLDPTNWPLLLAGSAVVTIPLTLVFLLTQRFFLQPLDRGVDPGRRD